MSNWIYNLPMAWMTLVVFLLTYAVTGGLYWLVMRLANGERGRTFKAVSPGMLPPLGIIFGLFIAFLASQVWRDFDEAQDAVNREASSLRAVVILSGSFPGEPEEHMHALIERHIQQAVTEEWPAMARHSATLTMIPTPLAEALQLTLSLAPHGEGQVIAQRQIASALESALEARRQRIIISESAVNWVKWCSVLLQAACALVAIAMVHSDNRKAAAIAMGIFATGVAASIVLIAAHTGPFSGEISVRPDLLLQVEPKQ
jgi:Protein of unknown function (DUF4239)